MLPTPRPSPQSKKTLPKKTAVFSVSAAHSRLAPTPQIGPAALSVILPDRNDAAQPANDGATTPLYVAELQGHLDAVQWLADNGGSVTPAGQHQQQQQQQQQYHHCRHHRQRHRQHQQQQQQQQQQQPAASNNSSSSNNTNNRRCRSLAKWEAHVLGWYRVRKPPLA